MNALIIGFGSIGKRHYEVLSRIDLIQKIDIVTTQFLPKNTTFTTLEEIEILDEYDYFLIASETYKHFNQIEYLEKNIQNKIILCEKPLFDKEKKLKSHNNHIYVGYVLRFHPLLQKIHSILQEENPIFTQILCGSYLPLWRPETDYRQSYSAIKNKGGGVLLDLSHEIDYLQWFFGTVDTISSYQGKVSDLEIDSDDLVFATGKTERGILFSLSLDYISKIPMRELLIQTDSKTLRADLIKNTLQIGTKEGNIQNFEIEKYDRNDLFRNMHLSILGNKKHLCTLQEGLSVMKTISTIQKQNHA